MYVKKAGSVFLSYLCMVMHFSETDGTNTLRFTILNTRLGILHEYLFLKSDLYLFYNQFFLFAYVFLGC